ncbi:hypothetical protein SSX86_011009 [Deinandra increscens subsp. villosa]|uniref:B-like cyclin n=1 Tax=Deinandra increscens subsp. villosa TaxID=3103831 RepID=A0AAP0DDJ9_9ASTR
MVVVKGLSTFKRRVSGDRVTMKSGGVRSLRVYTEEDKVKTNDSDHVACKTKRKSIPVKAEAGQINANSQKDALNKLGNIKGKNIRSAQTNVGRRVLADISNSRGKFQKNDTFDVSKPGKSKMERMTYSQRSSVSSSKDLKVFNGNPKTRPQGQKPVVDVTRKSLPVLKLAGKADKCDIKKVLKSNSKTRVHGQEVVGDVTRKFARSYCPPLRKSLPVLKHADKGNLDNRVKTKEKYGFSVKPKVGTAVIPQVSSSRWKNRVSDGSIKMESDHQPMVNKQRLSRVSMKPSIKTAVGIPRAPRVSRNTSVFTKSTSATSVLSNKNDETSRSESISCEQLVQDVTLDASTSKLTTKGKPGRRKSYTSLLIERTKLLKDKGSVKKEQILPNIYDDDNELEVAEYVDEIYQHYWVTEAQNQSLKNYMEIQTDITPQMRGIIINWLIEVHLKFDLMQETLYLMVTLLDYYLSTVAIKKNEMQLVGLTSLLLASKYEDFWHPKVMELISISAETYTRDQMLGMETTILTKLGYRLNMPTPYVFMLRFLKAAQGGKKFENLAFFLIELCLVEYDALRYKPSLLCASAIYIARCTLRLAPAWTPLLSKHSHYEEFQMRDCADMILGLHQASRNAVLRVTYDKFTSVDKCKVSLIKPLDKLPPL